MMLNGSGIKDPTAFKAIVNAEEEKKRMGAHGYADGDIVVAETPYGDNEILLLKCHRMYATGLKLNPGSPEENGIAIRSKTIMYADTWKFTYVYFNKIVSLVRTMEQEEFERVRKCVAETLGLILMDAIEVQESHTIEIDYEQIAKIVHDEVSGDTHDRDDYIRLQAERDIYKELFEKMMKKGE